MADNKQQMTRTEQDRTRVVTERERQCGQGVGAGLLREEGKKTMPFLDRSVVASQEETKMLASIKTRKRRTVQTDTPLRCAHYWFGAAGGFCSM